MFIAHLRFPVAAENRQAVIDAFMAEIENVRAMKGCLAFHPFLDPADESRFGVVHEWETEPDFNAYTASDAFRRFGVAVRPLMTGKPVSRRFRADLIEEVN